VQLVFEQDEHPDEPELKLSPDFTPNAEKSRLASPAPHFGHVAVSVPAQTKSSNFSPHLEHLNSYMGISSIALRPRL